MILKNLIFHCYYLFKKLSTNAIIFLFNLNEYIKVIYIYSYNVLVIFRKFVGGCYDFLNRFFTTLLNRKLNDFLFIFGLRNFFFYIKWNFLGFLHNLYIVLFFYSAVVYNNIKNFDLFLYSKIFFYKNDKIVYEKNLLNFFYGFFCFIFIYIVSKLGFFTIFEYIHFLYYFFHLDYFWKVNLIIYNFSFFFYYLWSLISFPFLYFEVYFNYKGLSVYIYCFIFIFLNLYFHKSTILRNTIFDLFNIFLITSYTFLFKPFFLLNFFFLNFINFFYTYINLPNLNKVVVWRPLFKKWSYYGFFKSTNKYL